MIEQNCYSTFSIEETSFLLGRSIEPEHRDLVVEEILRSKIVLITGAGGSIGSHLAKIILSYSPDRLVALDHSEKALFDLKMKLSSESNSLAVTYFLGDIKDTCVIKQLFSFYCPQIVFHTAAYKHVSFMQMYFYEAMINNVLGTKILVDTAIENRVDCFVFISTDKAVNPTSMMGASKRLGELYISGAGKQSAGHTRFIITRFGNVFHSSGSVVDVFLNQLKRGTSLTLTDPRAERFFMTIDEASDLVLKSLCRSNYRNAQFCVLKVGKPVKIKGLAERLMEIFSRENKSRSVGIAYIGLGQGEKIKEQLHYEYEILTPTSNPHVFEVDTPTVGNKDIFSITQALTQLREKPFCGDVLNVLMRQMIPDHFSSDFSAIISKGNL